MESTLNEKPTKTKKAPKKPRQKKIKPQVDFLEEIKDLNPEPGYIQIKKEKTPVKNTIKQIYLEVVYKPIGAPLEIRLGATQELNDNLSFDEETNRLYAMIVAKIDDLTNEAK